MYVWCQDERRVSEDPNAFALLLVPCCWADELDGVAEQVQAAIGSVECIESMETEAISWPIMAPPVDGYPESTNISTNRCSSVMNIHESWFYQHAVMCSAFTI